MTVSEAVRSSAAKGGAVVALVPVDGEERATLESSLAGLCDDQRPVDRNGDARFWGIDGDGAPWQVALLAVPRRPRTPPVAELWALYCDATLELRRTQSTDDLTAIVVAHQLLREECRH